ncbi:MaoC family dehydratase [Acinetobacter sp. B51(2017)]|uniref:MaoC family dehydratase n=1 Tax=Acinetobacter sp. B51(2017) TaxID=2060938 RepID=UPI000F0773F6|nr:MaoC family dehydratase [Acinetobacter sp. B51(2017)]
MLYLDDLSVGQRFISNRYEMRLEEILQFAKQYDPQSFHTDTEAAKQHQIFKGLAASGWHTSAVCMRLWTECMPIANGLVGTDSHVRWLKPTRAGDQIHVEVEITQIRRSKSKPHQAIVSYHTEALNQHHELLMTSDTNIVVFSKVSSAASTS